MQTLLILLMLSGHGSHTEAVCDRMHDFPNQENKNMKGKKVCVHCGKSGHTIDICYGNMVFLLDTNLTIPETVSIT